MRAHEGMKWVMSGESLKPEGVVALAGTAVMVAEAEATGIALTAYMVVAMMGAHSSGSLCVHLAAILAKDIYLLVGDDDHVLVHAACPLNFVHTLGLLLSLRTGA